MEAKHFFLFTAFVIVAANETQERILVEDLNSDHDRRHLDAGLPSSLKFNLKRQSGNFELMLEENVNLNLAAPVYELETDANGKKKLHKKKTEPLAGIGFYQDKINVGSFSVKCEKVVRGPCARMLTGSFLIDGRGFDIKPAPEVAYKRSVESFYSGTPHLLLENKQNAEPLSEDMLQSFRMRDFIEIPDNDRNNTHFIRERKRGSDRQKRTKTLYAVEILAVLDPTIWNNYLPEVEATETMTLDEAAEWYIRERYTLVLNGVSLRYQSIEDPEMEIYCTIAGFLLFKERDSTNPLPLGLETSRGGTREYVDAYAYLPSLRTWSLEVDGFTDYDHIMCFTYYDLYKDTTDQISIKGVAYRGMACTTYKVSLVEDHMFFVTTTTAAHELGHNLGADHDGEGSSINCPAEDDYIMNPMIASFDEGEVYSTNPWRFSQCSINAFKNYIDSDSADCLSDPGDYWNHAEYLQHTSKLPGELYDAETQCKLVHGTYSYVCESTDPETFCQNIKCSMFFFWCRNYIPARGTACGGENSNRWCIDGRCVEKIALTSTVTPSLAPTTTTTSTTTPASTASTTTPVPTTTTTSTTASTASTTTPVPTTTTTSTTPVPTTTTTSTTPVPTTTTASSTPPVPTTTTTTTTTPVPTTTTTTGTTTPVPTSPPITSAEISATTSPQSFQCSGDVGLDGFTCIQLKDILGMNKLCKSFAQECCGTCGPKCQGNKDTKIRGTYYNCEAALTNVLYNSVDVLCRTDGKNCCEFCT